jgi:prevent-host-death family protein
LMAGWTGLEPTQRLSGKITRDAGLPTNLREVLRNSSPFRSALYRRVPANSALSRPADGPENCDYNNAMKVVALRYAKQSLSAVVNRAQKERILITRHGRPAVLVIGVEGEELGDLLQTGDPKFWKMIDDRRREPTMSIEELEARLLETKPGRPRKARKRAGRTKTR